MQIEEGVIRRRLQYFVLSYESVVLFIQDISKLKHVYLQVFQVNVLKTFACFSANFETLERFRVNFTANVRFVLRISPNRKMCR